MGAVGIRTSARTGTLGGQQNLIGVVPDYWANRIGGKANSVINFDWEKFYVQNGFTKTASGKWSGSGKKGTETRAEQQARMNLKREVYETFSNMYRGYQNQKQNRDGGKLKYEAALRKALKAGMSQRRAEEAAVKHVRDTERKEIRNLANKLGIPISVAGRVLRGMPKTKKK